MRTFATFVGGAVILIALVVAFGFLMSWPVMMLWNGCLVPAVSGVSRIDWLQAWGILVLCGLLFKNVTSNK